MPISTATVPTANGSSYLRKLCQHWSHKFPVEYTAEHGTIDLPEAKCTLDASADALHVRLDAAEGADVPRLQEVVEKHIVRFAFKEELVFPWQAATN